MEKQVIDNHSKLKTSPAIGRRCMSTSWTVPSAKGKKPKKLDINFNEVPEKYFRKAK